MRFERVSPFALCVVLLVGCGAGNRAVLESGSSGGRLALRRVVLFQNGLGYFERRGVAEGRSVDLRVRPDQVDDVLKSLTVVDRAGATVASVRDRPLTISFVERLRARAVHLLSHGHRGRRRRSVRPGAGPRLPRPRDRRVHPRRRRLLRWWRWRRRPVRRGRWKHPLRVGRWRRFVVCRGCRRRG